VATATPYLSTIHHPVSRFFASSFPNLPVYRFPAFLPMSQIPPILKREFLGYFRSPVAYVFLIVFLTASVGCAFFLGGFFKANIASLESYFAFLPWLFIPFVPAVGMRLWSEEKRAGTIELLFTLPVTTLEAVLGKFLAAWAFLGLAIVLSFPMALTVGYLGSPDWGVIASSYLGAVLMAGGYLGICSLASAFTKNQVVSFVISLFVCFLLVLLGWSVFTGFLGGYLGLPPWLVDAVSNFSFKTHFDPFIKGIIDPRDVAYFLSLAGFCLCLNVLVLDR
jgi:ABC-2 type transport system permease protein